MGYQEYLSIFFKIITSSILILDLFIVLFAEKRSEWQKIY
jgi:hypothetical protein